MIQESFNRPDMVPIIEQFSEYLRYERRGGLAQGTIDRYLLDLRHIQTQTGKHLFELKVYKDVSDAIRGLKKKYDWSRSTTKNCANAATIFYNWAIRFQLTKDNPMQYGHEFKLGELTQMDFFDWEDPAFKKLIFNPNNSVQEYAIFHSLRSSGMRASPLCRLKFRNPCDVFLKERVFRIRLDKGGRYNEVNFDGETQDWLYRHMRDLALHAQLDFLFQRKNFTKKFTPRDLNRLVHRRANTIGIEAYPQKFRRSLGGEMISNGADLTMVKDQLCHKRISTTADHYVKFSTKRKKENYDRYVPKMGFSLEEPSELALQEVSLV